MDTRVIFKNNTTLTDFTVEANDYFNNNANSIDIVAADDYMYFGSRYPFNHLYFKFGTANATASVLTIAVWDGSNFTNVKEKFDETLSSGATFGQNGYITWVPDVQGGWSREDTASSSGNEQVTGLGNVTIYDHYWVRFAFSADLDAGTTLAWTGNLFSNDDALGIEYPDLVRAATMNAWDDGGSKSSWEEQHVFAAKEIIKELKNKRIIVHRSQILDRKDYESAAVAKVAEIAYRGMGRDFEDDKLDAMKLFQERINRSIGLIDQDMDAQKDRQEIKQMQGRLTRGPLGNVQRGFS